MKIDHKYSNIIWKITYFISYFLYFLGILIIIFLSLSGHYDFYEALLAIIVLSFAFMFHFMTFKLIKKIMRYNK